MRTALLVVVLVACGDDAIVPSPDAASPDARPDAAPPKIGCPPIGSAPHFSPDQHVVATDNCFEYSHSVDANRAIAACHHGELYEGAIDQPLMSTGLSGWGFPLRIYPEGDRLVTLGYNGVPFVAIWQRGSTGWMFESDAGIPLVQGDWPASVTAGSPRRLFIFHNGSVSADTTFTEYEGDGSAWTAVPNGFYNVTPDLGATPPLSPPSVSPDGLRMVFSVYYQGSTAVLYTDRPSINDRFRPAVPLTDVDPLDRNAPGFPFLVPDCSRIYFDSILNATVYQQQI